MIRALLALLLLAAAARGGMTVSGTATITGTMQASGDALTVPGQVINVSPANGATHVTYLPTISWQNGGGALTYQAYFDTSNPPTTSVQNSSATSYSPSALSFSTTYYLKINSINNSGTTTGSVYSFATEPAYAIDGYSSFNVGGSDGDAITPAKMDTGTEISLGTWTLAETPAIAAINTCAYKIASLGTTDSATWISLGATGPTPAVGDTFTAVRDGTVADGTGTMTVPRLFVAGTARPFYSSFTRSGTVYTNDSATTGIKSGMDSWGAYTRLRLGSTVSAMTVGFWIKFGPLASVNPIAQDLWQADTAAGGFVDLSLKVTAGVHTLRCHTDKLSGVEINVAPDTWYWITFDCSAHGTGGATDTLKVYDTGGTLLGTSTSDVSASTVSNWRDIFFGRCDAHTGGTNAPSTSYITFSGFVINTSTLTFPLGP